MGLKIKQKEKDREIDLEDPEVETDEIMSALYDEAEEKFKAQREGIDGLQEESEEKEEVGEEEQIEAEEDEEEEKKEPLEIEDEEDEEDPEKIERTISQSEFEPPPNWSEEAKEDFNSLPNKQKEQIVTMQRGMQGDFQKAMNSFSGIADALQPIQQECLQVGIKYEDAIRKMVGAHLQLSQNPVEGMRLVMRTYGVTPEQVLGVSKDGDIPKAAADRIAQLEEKVNQTHQTFFNQQSQTIDQTVAQFKSEKEFLKDDDIGRQIEQEMSMMVASHQQMGQPIPPLQDLYDKACWANPTVRAKLVARQKLEETNEKIDKRKEKVAKSKRAARTAKRGGSAKTEEKDAPKTLHDVLSRQWDEAEAKLNEKAG